jgi:Macrophage migration inhibitory factor (MIF)
MPTMLTTCQKARATSQDKCCGFMQPCGVILLLLPRRQVSSIGYIGGDKNISITQQLSAVVEKQLGIPPARVYVNVRLALHLPCM